MRAAIATLAVAVIAVLGLATSTAGAHVDRPAFPTRPTRVLVLGDSVILGAQSAIPAALPGREVTEDAVVSRSTSATAAAAAGHGTDWDVVVILVAHNDGGSPSAYQPGYRRMLDQFAGASRVVLLTLHEVRPYYGAVNAFLRSQVGARPNVSVVDWNAVANANPGATGGDGLHLTGSGARLMADLIAGQVVEAEAAAEPPPTTTTTAPPTTTLPPTTTAPPTTTTLPPTTTTAAPPATTTTTTAARVVAVRSVGPRPPDPGEQGPSSRWVWPTLVAAVGAAALGLQRVARRLPT